MFRLALLLFVFAPALFAQEVDQEEPGPDTAVESQTGQPSADSESEDGAQASTEDEADARFIPTEEISQDLGVSFPVDI